MIDDGHYTEADFPFTIKPIFSTLGSIVEIPSQGQIITLLPDESKRYLSGFTIYEEYILSNNPVDILPFDNFFLKTDIAQGMIFKSKRSGTIHNFNMDVDPGCKNFEKVRGGLQWFMMGSKDFFSTISFKLKNEKRKFSIT